MPLVSIVIDSFNYDRFLAEAIDSALNQTYPHVEVIVVDDGSTDTSPEIISSYGERVNPVFKTNAGQGSAFNVGFARSRGSYVIYLDSDDMLLPTAAARSVEKFDDELVVKVHWPLQIIDASGRTTGEIRWDRCLPEGDLQEEVVRVGPAMHDNPPTSGNAWSRAFLERVLPMPEEPFRICPDSYLITLAPIFGRIAKLNDAQGLYRVHGANHWLMEPLKKASFTVQNIDLRCNILRDVLAERGILVDTDQWKQGNSWYRGWQFLEFTLREIDEAIPPSMPFILIDQQGLGLEGSFEGRPVAPFTEQDGVYWGPPADDAAAIGALERMREAGYEHLVVASYAFWWLDHYPGLRVYLNTSGRCMVANERVAIYTFRK